MAEEYPDFPEGVNTSWELITPEIAAKYLELNTSNRQPRKHNIGVMAQDMTRGRFRITHQGIAFDDDNIMLDGQQRCMAVVDSGVACWMLVTVGLPHVAQENMDLGAKRQYADFMEGSYGTTRAAALRIVLGFYDVVQNGTFDPVKLGERTRWFSVPELLDETSQQNLEISETYAGKAREAARNLPSIMPAPLLAATIITFGSDTEAGLAFLEPISTLVGLDTGDPRLALVKFRGAEGKNAKNGPALAVCLRIIYAYRKNQTYSLIRNMWASIKLE